ncbi:MAG: hypothetical protein SGJ00_14370 [bacterium]|nr:hypothetical protein [bacterium]
MKTLKTTFLLIAFVFISFHSFAQSEYFGKWHASCFFERSVDAKLSYCGICPVKIDEKNNSLNIDEFEIAIDSKNIQVTAPGRDVVTCTYTYNSKMEAFTFKFDKATYTFKVLRGTQSDFIIFKNDCGQLLLSKK